MRKTFVRFFVLVFHVFIAFFVVAQPADAVIPDSLNSSLFIKYEINSGLKFDWDNGSESLNTSFSQSTGSNANNYLLYNLGFNSWKFLTDRQESFNLSAGIGPLYLTEDYITETTSITSSYDNRIFGLTLSGEADYSGRYYYDSKSYALIEAYGFGKLEKNWIKSDGLIYLNENPASADTLSQKYMDNRFQYGLEAKAGIGFGKMNPVNYKMQAEFLMNNFYPGMLFSEYEKELVAGCIAKVKNKRKLKNGHHFEIESEEILDFLKRKMLLKTSELQLDFLKYGEFAPRFSGKRFELGPLFNFYNSEPDFIYGGFVQYEKYSYKNFKWNVNVSTELSYNRYKKRDWFLWENNIQFEYFADLRTKYTFGLKYIPGLVVNDFEDIEPVQHALIPYFELYHQVNQKQRVSLGFSYKITGDNDFFVKGPEFSLSFYSSKY